LGLLSIESAATLWFELNLVMLFLSIWFLTDDWPGRLRLISFPLGLLFLPVLGALSIGQFNFPVLLGISMAIYAIKKENITLTTIGMVLITFKPHLGALALMAVLIYLAARRDSFGRYVLFSGLITAVLLILAGFIADPKWLIRYPSLLFNLSSNYGQSENTALCTNCTNLPVLLSRWLFAESLMKAAMIAVVIMLIVSILFFIHGTLLIKNHSLLINTAIITTLLVSPYLFNYDFILLLIPFAFLVNTITEKIVTILCYLSPTLALILYGRNGNNSLLFVSIVAAIFLYLRAKSQVDVPVSASYNGDR